RAPRARARACPRASGTACAAPRPCATSAPRPPGRPGCARAPSANRVGKAPARIRTSRRVIPADLVPPGCTWPIVLGIDPGTRTLGYGALVLAPAGPRFLACGVLAPRARAPVPARLAEIQAGLERLLAALRPGVLALERAFHSKNAQS